MPGRAGAVHGVLVTYRRPDELAVTLQRLAEQTKQLDSLTVVDNDADPLVHEIVADVSGVAGGVNYYSAPENLGPAGGLSFGASRVLRTADEGDWVMFLDDDDPPRSVDMFSETTAFAEEMVRRDPNMAGVGLVGARFDSRTGLAVRIVDRELSGPVPVDYIGGGQLPCYRVAVMREVGLPDPKLFFAFDDLEYGLRLTAAGHQLYMNGETCLRERRAKGLIGIDRRPSRKLAQLSWRDYYSTRNLVWILRSRGQHVPAARVVTRRVLAKAALNIPHSPRLAWAHLVMSGRASVDAYRSQMGRTIDPAQWSSQSER